MATTTGLIPNWFPPTRENYNLIISLWQWFPLFASLQWLIPWYGMGKTSVTSRLNLPGRIGWLTMEAPGFLTLLYHLRTLPPLTTSSSFSSDDDDGDGGGLPWQNKVLAALFVLHYTYRALLFPFLQPSMSPVHIVIWLSGLSFQLINGLAIGSWLAAYGPTTQDEWDAQLWGGGTGQFAVGIALFYVGLVANYYHDDELREIRRRAGRRRAAVGKGKKEGSEKGGVDKHYEIPQGGLFKVMLYPHYFVEWVEWFGFWMAAGWGCVPARCFLFNEIAAMLPRAVKGRQWYVERFGEEKIKGRWAVIPGVW
ncbi:steroid 5-alpha-reductase DET2 [Chaetomidium leptoderma]|uniref:Steroid 5-alpha-reductase DET2 n=1 Tax=Chaetomidium leptoderma TaxID=669021 RepID=A0AAN7A0L5_9PEZI|nr:steroid 5-alpha-reductase DET2 [Chaetomidium leptoderma]